MAGRFERRWEPDSVSNDPSGVPDRAGHLVVVLYNDHIHRFDEVALQIRRATGRGFRFSWRRMLRVHEEGRAVVFRGPGSECDRVATVLRELRLQVEVYEP